MLDDTLLVIPSRLSSTRLHNKPLASIHGYPMIYWVANRIKRAKICNYIVATDAVEIQDVCRRNNLNVILTDHDCRTGTDRVAEVAEKMDYKYYCNVQGDEPLINTDGVRQFIEQGRVFKNTFVQAVTQVQGNKTNYSEVKVAIDSSDNIRFLSRLDIPFDRNSNKIKKYKCLGLYLYDKDFILKYSKLKEGNLEKAECIEQLRCIENNLNINSVKVDFDYMSIDTPEVLFQARSLDIGEYYL